MKKFFLILAIGSIVSCKKNDSKPTKQEDIIVTIAGKGTRGFSGDGGSAIKAEFSSIEDLVVVGSNIFIADKNNDCIRKIDASGQISVVAGLGIYRLMPGEGNGVPATQAEMDRPSAICVDNDGTIYTAERLGRIVRKIDASGTITSLAGTFEGRGYSGDGGPATQALFGQPTGIAVDADGNIFVSDIESRTVRKISTSGMISLIAGTTLERGNEGDGGPATAAKLCEPYGLALDSVGNLYIADHCGQSIRKVTPSGIISTFAGNGNAGHTGDNGSATAATLNGPMDITFDYSGNMFIAEGDNNCIRKVNSAGIITTVTGTGVKGFSGDGKSAIQAKLAYPTSVAVDVNGNIYIADHENNRIRKVIKAY